ncbi:hypothetical protein HJG60_008889 [Phyllostomus discolor]|uniref:Uncharacterized protein n=1 Tax=Phyllostomus discolor TaxID=89673 RepID=A0A833YWH5_9CHIR|nr:hypothetical protein HJG60_008889 [Phyllostomus discolor]
MLFFPSARVPHSPKLPKPQDAACLLRESLSGASHAPAAPLPPAGRPSASAPFWGMRRRFDEPCLEPGAALRPSAAEFRSPALVSLRRAVWALGWQQGHIWGTESEALRSPLLAGCECVLLVGAPRSQGQGKLQS